MFVTLKLPSDHSDTGMEQVALKRAGPDGDRNRGQSSRRPACIACQRKRLRCTGSIHGCDRCRTRSIPCVFPTSLAKHSNNPSSAQGLSWQKSGGGKAVAESGENALELGQGGKPPSQQEAGPSVAAASHDNDLLEGNLFDMNFENDIPHLPMDLSRNNPQLDDSAIMGVMDTENSDTYHPDSIQYVLNLEKLPQTLPVPTQESPAMLSLDTLVSSNESSAQPALGDPLTGGNPQKQERSPPGPVPTPCRDSDSRSDSPPCFCIHNTVRVVQQLDDDDFKITSLSLDQVVQLQKWIMSQCCKPLDCPNCNLLPTVHTVLVIICDRLTEMFECIHKRIQKSGNRLSGQGDPSDQRPPSESWESSSSSTTERSEQLYCTSSSGAASKANCNPVLFSPDLQSMYSDEEQMHMIRVILKLQIRNFRGLLVRVDNVSQIAGSEARRARVKSMAMRLMKAETEIDNTLRVLLHIFAIS